MKLHIVILCSRCADHLLKIPVLNLRYARARHAKNAKNAKGMAFSV